MASDAPATPAPDLIIRQSGDAPTLEEILQGSHELPRWMGWRLRLLVMAVLTGFAAVFLAGHWLSVQPRLPGTLHVTPEGQIRLHSLDLLEGATTREPVVEGLLSEPRSASRAPPFQAPMDVLLMQRSARWIDRLEQRERFFSLHHAVNAVLKAVPEGSNTIELALANAPDKTVRLTPRGWEGLNLLFWLLSGLALAVFAVGAVVVLAGPQWRNVGYAIIATCQAGQLLLIAMERNLDLFAPDWFLLMDTRLRTGFDLATAAAVIQVAVLHPKRIKGWPYVVVASWAAALGLAVLGIRLDTPDSWWWIQIGCGVMGATAIVLMGVAYRTSPHPFTLVMQRLSTVTLATWVLMSAALAQGGARPDMQLNISAFGVMIWHVFLASEVLLAPYLSRSKQILQEFSLLAASSTVAASLDLVFVAVFSLGQFTSMTLSLFMSFGVYMSVRRWLVTRLPGRDPITTERLFERLYRIARELERQPGRLDDMLSRLMRELFDPLEVTRVQGEVPYSQLRGNGSVLVIKLPALQALKGLPRHVLVLKHSNKGRRLFTSDDARLADRIIDQLHRVLSFDQAVEQGRSEERIRIAQDLHDDIGARLLTLMYQAPNADIEEYIRHTLQDLKTLTRGLAAQSHPLSDAASEWKRDIGQRLGAARCELTWLMELDCDLTLSMVQWSALTRVLRELVNNTISHAKATKVQVELVLSDDRLLLTVTDNGLGREPGNWAHGLGLGGVRKRVKQLGGSVSWSENSPRGVRCEVVIESFSNSAGPGASTNEAQPSH